MLICFLRSILRSIAAHIVNDYAVKSATIPSQIHDYFQLLIHDTAFPTRVFAKADEFEL